METPPPPLFVLSKYRITLLLFNASRKSTLSYGYMAISKAVTVGNNKSLSTKLVDQFDQQSSTELGRATYRQGPLGATGPEQDAKDFAWLVSGFSKHLYQTPTTVGWQVKRSELFPAFPILMSLRFNRQLRKSPHNTAKGIFLIILPKNIL